MKVRQAMTWACGVLVALQAIVCVPEAQAHASEFGRITGVICDDKTGRPLDFVNVIVVGTTMGAMSRNGGRFEIGNVPVGEYRLVASADYGVPFAACGLSSYSNWPRMSSAPSVSVPK